MSTRHVWRSSLIMGKEHAFNFFSELWVGVCSGFLELSSRWCDQSACGCCWACAGAAAASYRVYVTSHAAVLSS